MTSKARRPYLGLQKSLIEFFTAPVRYLKESNEKESEFEKPYEGADYPSMQLDIPAPDWPTWEFDTERKRYPPAPVAEKVGTGPGCKGCVLSSYRILADDCPDKPVTFYSSSRCVSEKRGFFAPPSMGKVKSGAFAAHGWGNTTLSVIAVVGEIIKMEPGHWASQHPDVDVWVNSDIETHVLLGWMVDDLGNVCYETVEVSCEACDCVGADPFVFDDGSTPDTIAPGAGITVYVSGGCAPYSWAGAGTGYSWGSGSTTTDPENVLTSASGD